MLAAPSANDGSEVRVTADGNGASGSTDRLVDEWRNAAYNCFSSGHKFCREVCPVLQVTHDETHSPTAFHANVVAMDKGLLEHRGRRRGLRQLHAVRGLRAALPEHASSPATSTASARAPSTSSRPCARSPSTAGIHQPGWQRWNLQTDELKNEPVLDGRRRRSASPTGRPSSTCPSAARRSCSATARRRSTARRSRGPSRSCCRRPASSSG